MNILFGVVEKHCLFLLNCKDMDALNKKYNIKIEVLTPLFIGAGTEKEWIRGVDFVVKDGKAYKLGLKKISRAGGVNLLELSEAFKKKDENKVINLISNDLLSKVSDKILDWPADSSNDVKTFIKNQFNGKPLLAGSSLKGAVRSILFKSLRKNEKDEKLVFGSSNEGDEFMRFIKFADAEFENTALVNTKIFNLQTKNEGGWKHASKNTDYKFKRSGFNTIYECIMPRQQGYASIMFSTKAFDAFKRKGKHKYEVEKQRILENITTLFKIVNKHTQDYLSKEKLFFGKYNQADNTYKIIESIDRILAQIPSDNKSCILKMSAGSGFHSITGDWQFDDYSISSIQSKGTKTLSFGCDITGKIAKSAKSRKIAVWDNHFDLMGFIRISVLSEEEYKALQEKKQRALAEREAKQKEQELKEKLERDEREKKERELKKQTEEYNKYFAQAKQAYDNGKWKDAVSFAEKARAVFPDKSDELKDLIANAKSKIESMEKQEIINTANRKEEEDRKLKNSVPLSEKIANVEKLPTLFGNLKTWMEINNRESLSKEEESVLCEKIVSLYSSLKKRDKADWKSKRNKWKDLSLLLGDDFVSKLLKNL